MKGKRILIFQQRGWALNIGHFLATRLRDEGCHLAAITMKKSTHEFVLKQQDVNYELIISDDEILNDPKTYLGSERYSLEQICDDLGVNTIWPLVMSVRNYVRSYAYKYYYGFRQNVSDEQMVFYVQALYKSIQHIFKQFKPDLVIVPIFGALPHIMLNLYAKKRGVPMLGVTDARVRGVYYFTHSYLEDKSFFIDRINELNSGVTISSNRKRAKRYIEDFKSHFVQPEAMENFLRKEKSKTWWQKIKHELSPFYQSLRWYLKPNPNFSKNIGVTTDYRPPRIIFRDHYANKHNRRFASNYDYYPLERVGKFVYFPLQFQPESAIDIMAPYFSNQIETARQVAMSLPGDYTLVVKEHPAMVGLRSTSYLEKLDKTPNVKLVDHRISGEEILKKTALVISPSGTTIAEAALLRVPVIQLGDLGTTMKLPNVFHHTDLTTLAPKIKEILSKTLGGKDYDDKLENYVAAAYDCGFDLAYRAIWEKGKGNKEKLWQLYRQEIEDCLLTTRT